MGRKAYFSWCFWVGEPLERSHQPFSMFLIAMNSSIGVVDFRRLWTRNLIDCIHCKFTGSVIVHDCMTIWPYDYTTIWPIWLQDYMIVWLSDYLTIWLCDSLSIWLYDYMTIWLCDSLSIWLHDYLTTWLHDYMHSANGQIPVVLDAPNLPMSWWSLDSCPHVTGSQIHKWHRT